MKPATTPTGRPKLGGSLQVQTEDGEWLDAETVAVGDSRPDEHGQRRVLVMLRLGDGAVTGWLWWDSLIWRKPVAA